MLFGDQGVKLFVPNIVFFTLKSRYVEKQRKDFYKFFSEHDRRRGTDFKKVYPELADFYENCKALC